MFNQKRAVAKKLKKNNNPHEQIRKERKMKGKSK